MYDSLGALNISNVWNQRPLYCIREMSHAGGTAPARTLTNRGCCTRGPPATLSAQVRAASVQEAAAVFINIIYDLAPH